MADFQIAHKRRLGIEGGAKVSMVADDNGNWTGGKKGSGSLIGSKYGVSAAMLCKFLGRTATVADMKNLSSENAEKIYKNIFWDYMRGDEFLFQDSANKVYDDIVNFGLSGGTKIQQRVFNMPETGKWSTALLNKINNK